MRPGLAWVGVRGLAAYYLATPVFLVLDLALGWPVRAAGIEDVAWRTGYYGVLLALGFVCRRWPSSTPFVGMGESTVNLLLLMLAVLLPIWSAGDVILAGGEPDTGLILARTVNLLLAGSVLVWSFQRSASRVSGGSVHRGAL